MENAIAVIKKEGSEYCLVFSDGRKECFASRKRAEKREKQINYFKHRDANSLSGEDLYALAHLDIYAIHNKDNCDETVFFISEESGIEAYLIKGSEDKEQMEVFKLDQDYENFSDYSDIISEANLSYLQAADSKSINLSEPIIENQLIGGGHTHTIDLSDLEFNNGFAFTQTSEDEDHIHFVEVIQNGNGYYVYSAPIKIGNLSLTHTHLIKVNLGDA